MNRFDRVTSILLLLQTRTVVTAKYLAEYFHVSERTIYRDVRTLENAGVPISSEAGVGYFLEKNYHLPPVSFTLDEAASLLLGEKLLVSALDRHSLQDFTQALNKIKAIINRADKDYLSALDCEIKVLPTGSHFPVDEIIATKDKSRTEKKSATFDKWLKESRSALVKRQVVEIEYQAINRRQMSKRLIEPIGLFYYSWHWHLIAWCQIRDAYRDFRLDRIDSFIPQSEHFKKDSRLTLKAYLKNQFKKEGLLEVELFFSHEAARFVGEQRYMFGFVEEEVKENGVNMKFLTSIPEYMSRWLLQYIDEVQVIKGDVIRESLKKYAIQLFSHWNKN